MVEAPTHSQMKWANALSTRPSLEAAIAEVVEQAQATLAATADLGLVFISSAFASEYSRLMPLLRDRLGDVPIIGCSGGGIVGCDRTGEAQEIEDEPALSLTLAHLPEVKVHTFHFNSDDLPDLDSPPHTWTQLIDVSPETQPDFILLADPMSKINDLLQGLDFAYPGAIKIGGLASSNSMGSGQGLFCNYKLYREGTVGVALSGKIVIEAIVAQGCRPIGQTYRVTEGERNILLGLEADTNLAAGNCGESRPPLEVLQELIQNLSDDDRMLAQHSLFIGVARSEFKQTLEAGDFLIRQVLGVDPRVGAIAVGDRVRPGQRVQFHLRDAQASAEDLKTLLDRYCQQNPQPEATQEAALMFSCLGRGAGLYGEPNFDSQLFSKYVGQLPLSGFFCNGEIGPIAGTTFLHGYTSVFGILRQS